ncbi:MAG: hypothetical protein MN733_27195 [Nitrososphaera sp.]|nr:hypothetical protein [Nitrososphaera sp.]
MPSDIDLYDSLDSTLWSLGEKTRNLVISAFELNGVSFRPSNVDVKGVDKVLSELFGIGANAIMVTAFDNLNRKLVIGFDDTKIADPVLKIRKWLEINGSREKATT